MSSLSRRQLAEKMADMFTVAELRGLVRFFRVAKQTRKKTYKPLRLTKDYTSVRMRDFRDIENARAAVHKELGRKWADGGTHFDHKLTDKMVEQAFNSLDKHAFGGTLRPMLLQCVPSLKFRINNTGGAAGYVAYRGRDQPMTLTLSHKVFGAMRKDGVYTDRQKTCRGNIECLVDTLEHEVIHMIHIAYASKGRVPSDTHHGAFFKTIFYNVFARTAGTHSYMNTVPKTKDILRKLKVGSKVKLRDDFPKLKGTWRVLQFMSKSGRVKMKRSKDGVVRNVNPYAIASIVR